VIFNQLGRVITRGRTFIPEVDGLRCVAIASVVFYHLSGYTLGKHMTGATIQAGESWLPKVFGIGHYGVQLFFVLSGFLLAMPFAKWRFGLATKPSLRSYYCRRVTRLEPPYIVALVLVFFVGVLAHRLTAAVMSWPDLSNWPNLLASLVYQHNLIYGRGSLITIVIWSLEIEVQFYMLAPALAAVFSIRHVVVRRVILLTAMIAIPFIRSFVPAEWKDTVNSLPWYLEWFATGFLLTDLYLVDWKQNPDRSLVWDGASLCAWPVLTVLLLSNRLLIALAPLVLLAYVGAFRGKISNWVFRRPVITVMGGMCYSMYLLHYSVISGVGMLTKRLLIGSTFATRFALDALMIMPAILVTTVVFFVALERPCMDPTWPAKVGQQVRWWRKSKKRLASRLPTVLHGEVVNQEQRSSVEGALD
jgi:peptidoglycan/LPS O-acetylase OafA/YrhL